MDQPCISEDLVILCLPGENWSFPTLEKRLCQSLRQAGLPLWPAANTELFCAGGQSLFVARRPRRLYIELEDLETLLAALPHCPAATALYALPEGFLLALNSRDAGLWIREFGKLRQLPETWELRAREQGLCLSRDAARDLLPLYSISMPTAADERMG